MDVAAGDVTLIDRQLYVRHSCVTCAGSSGGRVVVGGGRYLYFTNPHSGATSEPGIGITTGL